MTSALQGAPALAAPSVPGSTATDRVPTAQAEDFARASRPRVDEAIDGIGAADGYHVRVASGAAGFAWRDVAVLRPAGLDPSTWYGYQCLSDDGAYAAVVVLPGDEINEPTARDRGGYAFSVDVTTGKVIALSSGVGLKYHSPGCGLSDVGVFTANPGTDEASTEVLAYDLHTGAQRRDSVVAGQVTAVVPVGDRLVGAQDSALVDVPSGGSVAHPVAITGGLDAGGSPYDLRPSVDGGLDLLVRDPHAQRTAVEHLTGSTLRPVGAGPLDGVRLYGGADGRNSVVGAAVASGTITTRDASSLPLGVETLSLDGHAAFGAAPGGTTAAAGRAASDQTEAAAQASLPLVESESDHKAYRAAGASLPGAVTPGASPLVPVTKAGQSSRSGADRRPTEVGPAPEESDHPIGGSPRPGRVAFDRTGGASLSVRADVADGRSVRVESTLSSGASTPKCSIPRLQASLEAMQPSNAQVNWATQMAEQGLLTGASSTRPANFANMGLASYSPSSDFPPIALTHPSGSATSAVPRSVMLAIEAQESNFNQASWHALPGIAGDPLIASYYGVGDSIDHIDYPDADCGYGIAQVTTGMAASDTSISRHGEMKIAVDYQEDIAAGLQILEKTWNTLAADGITANNGDPEYLENWYFAAWAYNTGIQPTASFGNTSGCAPSPSCTGPDGTWGVGWSNNPQNPDYDPARKPYLQSSYADAAHPSSWPYQERIMGWMASPILRYGYFGYNPPTYNGGSTWLQVPPVSAFCNSSDDCAPGDSGKQYCTLTDSECWWHQPVTWVASCSTTCATSGYEVGAGSAEPTYSAKYTPTCNQDGAVVPPGSIIVDDLADPTQDDQGCQGMNWSNGGSFTFAPGTNASGDPIGDIDTHQLGSGFGGHVLFTHTEPVSSSSLIDTGTWTPNLPSRQYYKVKVHLPASGATATDVVYTIDPGGGAAPWHIRVNQAWGSEQWVTIGTFGMQNGGDVVLTNGSGETPQASDVAFDAVAFVPQGGDASTPLGGPPGIRDAPAGSNPAWVNCGCGRRTAGDPVDTATGAFGQGATDLTTPGLGLPLHLARKYSAMLADPAGPSGSGAVDGPFGHGWTFDYGMTAKTDASGNVTVVQEDGSPVPFTASSSGFTATAPRYDATLVKSGSTFVFTRRGNDQFVFDVTTGRLTSESDTAGRAASPTYSTTFGYDSGGKLSTATDPGGRVYTFTWSGPHIAKVVTSGGQEVDYGYDSAGDLTDVYGTGTTRSAGTLGNQDRTQYSYDGRHLLLTLRTPADFSRTGSPTPVTTNVYDSSERVTAQTDPDGDTTTFTYGPDSTTGIAAGQTLVTDPAGHRTLDTYSNGLLASETAGYGTAAAATTTYQYDPMTLGVTVETDPDGATKTASYDDQGDRVSSSDGLGRATSWQYDAAGHVTAVIDPTGVVTRRTYNAAGAQTSEAVSNTDRSAESSGDTLNPVSARQTSATYADAAHPAEATTTTDALGAKTTHTFDADGDVTSTTDPLGRTTDFGYALALGRRTSVVAPAGVAAGTTVGCTPPATGCETFAYDAEGDVVLTTDPMGHTTKATFDADGDQLTTTDADGHTTTTTYDAADRKTKVTKPSGVVTSTTYNGDGTVARSTDARGDVTTYTYDARGEELTATDPDGKVTAQTWNPTGTLATSTRPDGVSTTYTYDAAGEVTGRSSSDHTASVSWTRDSDGRPLSMTDGTGTTTSTYDVFGELTASTNGAGQRAAYGYDADGNTVQVVYPGAGAPSVSRGFDASGQLTSVTDPAGSRSTFRYDADGALVGESLGNGDSVSMTYDADGHETATSATHAGSVLGTIAYTRDGVGDVLTQTPSAGAPGPTTTYTYTADQYLASAKTTSTTSFGYDASGDPTATVGGSQAFDAAGRLCWSAAGTVASPSCSSAPSGATKYTYDVDGDRTAVTGATGTAQSSTYDGVGELTSVSSGGSAVASYGYDGNGLRATKTTASGTSRFTWDARSKVAVLLADSAHDYVTGPAGAVLEQFATGSVDWFFHDAHGSTAELLGSSGAVVGSYSYGPTGAVATHSGTDSSAIQFAGAFVDGETGYLYLQARYYDPRTAEFLTVDPAIAVTGQAYEYASNDPGNATDPLGLETWWNPTTWDSETWAWVGVGLGATALALTGVGLFVDLGAAATVAVGASAVGLSAVGEGLDANGCFANHDSVACAGAVLNGVALLGATADLGGAVFGVEALEGIGIAALPPALIGFGVDVYGAVKTTEEQEEENAEERRREHEDECARLGA